MKREIFLEVFNYVKSKRSDEKYSDYLNAVYYFVKCQSFFDYSKTQRFIMDLYSIDRKFVDMDSKKVLLFLNDQIKKEKKDDTNKD